MNLYKVSYNAWQGGEDWDVDTIQFEAFSEEGADMQFRQWARERKVIYKGQIGIVKIFDNVNINKQ